MNLDELQRLAEGAGDGYMEIDAETVLKLLKVARAAQGIAGCTTGDPNRWRTGAGCWTTINARTEVVVALRTALETFPRETPMGGKP